MNADDVDTIVSEIDHDRDGQVSFAEFVALLQQETFMEEARLQRRLLFDLDHDGGIDVGEMFEIVGNMDDAKKVMTQYDVDDDGVSNFSGECWCSLGTSRVQTAGL